jgi:hypothetical protein
MHFTQFAMDTGKLAIIGNVNCVNTTKHEAMRCAFVFAGDELMTFVTIVYEVAIRWVSGVFATENSRG